MRRRGSVCEAPLLVLEENGYCFTTALLFYYCFTNLHLRAPNLPPPLLVLEENGSDDPNVDPNLRVVKIVVKTGSIDALLRLYLGSDR